MNTISAGPQSLWELTKENVTEAVQLYFDPLRPFLNWVQRKFTTRYSNRKRWALQQEEALRRLRDLQQDILFLEARKKLRRMIIEMERAKAEAEELEKAPLELELEKQKSDGAQEAEAAEDYYVEMLAALKHLGNASRLAPKDTARDKLKADFLDLAVRQIQSYLEPVEFRSRLEDEYKTRLPNSLRRTEHQ